MKKHLIIIGTILVSSACSRLDNAEPQSIKNTWKAIEVGDVQISVADNLIIHPTADENRRNIDNDFNDNDLDLPEEYRVSIYTNNSSPCAPSLTGVSSFSSITNEQARWGRVDAFDEMDEDGNWPEGYESPIELSKIVCKKEGSPRPKEVYSLCSEKNGKTVVICISQMKDDPAMAKQIFETFRWTE